MGITNQMKRRQFQFSFQGDGFHKPANSFGGSLLKGNPKAKRPLDSKLPILLTLRAQKSLLRLPKTFAKVAEIVDHTAQKHGFKIYSQANVGNHLHILMKIPRARAWAAFIRELTGRIAQAVTAILTGDPLGTASGGGAGFWRFRPHTRIVGGWRKAFAIAQEYVHLNKLEADGFISRRETKTLKDYRMIWADG